MRPTPIIFVFCCLGFMGCAQFPELDQRISPDVAAAAPPALVPLGPILNQAAEAPGTAASAETELAPRIAALRARAANLRRPVIGARDRARMRAAMLQRTR